MVQIKNKILIIANTSWAIYNFRNNLIQSLLKNNYEVYFASQKDEYTQKVINLGAKHIRIEFDNSSKNPIKDLIFLLKIIQSFIKYKPSIILAYSIKANIYSNISARILNIPIISNISGLGSLFIADNIFSKLTIYLYKISLQKTSKIFFQNQTDFLLFKDHKIIKKQLTEMLPGSGVDLGKFQLSKSCPKSSENIKFLLVARLLRDKGVIEYVEAARVIKKKHPNIVFEILGEIWKTNPTAIKKGEVDSWVAEGIIDYLGFTHDVRSFIENADVIVLPSYREGMSRVLLESAAMGKPLITTDVPGCREIVDDEINGFLCKVKDSIDLSEKIEKMLLLSNDARQSMGIASRQKVKKEFDEKIVISKYLQSIKKILNQN